jgi:hypothetical protein
MPRRTVVIQKTVDPALDALDDGPEAGALAPIGTRQQIVEALARYNTAPDGGKSKSPLAAGMSLMLYGPGMYVEVPMQGEDDDITQFLVTMTDEDFAFPVLARACRAHRWTMMDPESGQSLRFG